MRLPVIQEGDPRLRNKSASITDYEPKRYRKFVEDLTQTMYEEDGIGIASPQVGENIRLVVISTSNGPLVMVNPEILKKSWRAETAEEGCLSVRGVFGPVKRARSVTVKFTDRDGKKQQLDTSGLFARVIQHEVDHIDGILFIDRAASTHQVDQGEKHG